MSQLPFMKGGEAEDIVSPAGKIGVDVLYDARALPKIAASRRSAERLAGEVSRRDFLAATTTLLASRTVRGQQRGPTAQQIADRIRANVGVTWRETTVDGFKAGDPETIVTGVMTTVMATFGVLRTAVEKHCNFIVTEEPTFYAGNDNPGPRATDPVYLAKKAFIDERRIVIWRFADHWRARRPSEEATALAATLGWTGYRAPDSELIYRVPEMTLGDVVAHIQSRLGTLSGTRTVGPRNMRVRTVFLSPGTTDVPSAVRYLPRADVIVAGEPREWEAVPYVLDSRSAGQEKAMIALGRLVSQAPGMRACASWIRGFVPEVPIVPITLADPYWSPSA